MQEIYYKVADLYFKVVLPEDWKVKELLPSFVNFYHDAVPEDKLIFSAFINDGGFPKTDEELKEIGTSENDIGNLRLMLSNSAYWAEMHYGQVDKRHRWTSDRQFRKIKAQLCTEDSLIGLALTSVLRIGFSQSILRYKGISIHSSCVMKDGIGYLFLGKSGTGKSTHSRLWRENLEGVELLNDDNPALRIMDDQLFVFGTPWSGKTPCYKQQVVPVGGIVRLEQAPVNQIRILESIEAFTALLPSCSAVQHDRLLQDLLYDNLIEICELAKVAWLKCLPDREAALLSYKNIKKG